MSHPVPGHDYDPLDRLSPRKERYHKGRRADKQSNPDGFVIHNSMWRKGWKLAKKSAKARALAKKTK
jgi:hypothetical protein